MRYDSIKIMGMVSYPANKIPKNWEIFGYITSYGLLYTINFNSIGITFNSDFFTEKEVQSKINIHNRKEKLNKIKWSQNKL